MPLGIWNLVLWPGIKLLSTALAVQSPDHWTSREIPYMVSVQFSSVQFSHLAVSNTLWSHELQHARLLCPPLSSGVCSSSCPLSWWCHPTISSSAIPFSCPQSFQAPISLSELILCLRGPKYWSFSISPSSEYSGLISFRSDWLDLLVVQETPRQAREICSMLIGGKHNEDNL